MGIECFLLVGDAKTPVTVMVKRTVNAFLSANPKLGNAVISVSPDLSTTAGKAFVSIVYDGSLSVLEAPAAPVAPAAPAPAASPAPAAPAEVAETSKE